jgi:hypothetical protein
LWAAAPVADLYAYCPSGLEVRGQDGREKEEVEWRRKKGRGEGRRAPMAGQGEEE